MFSSIAASMCITRRTFAPRIGLVMAELSTRKERLPIDVRSAGRAPLPSAEGGCKGFASEMARHKRRFGVQGDAIDHDETEEASRVM